MPDLRTPLASLELSNPVIAGSSEFTMTERGIRACIDAGAGAVVAKSVNEDPRSAAQLDMARYAVIDDARREQAWADAKPNASLFNQSGLAQTSLDDWLALLQRCQDHALSRGSQVIGSITVAEAEPAAEIAAQMGKFLKAIEINLSAPHGREAVGNAVRQINGVPAVSRYTSAVRAATTAVVIVKLPAQADDVVALAQAAADAGADAVTLTGRYQGFLPDLDTQRPVLGSWGAIGGAWALPLSLYWISKSHLALPPGYPLIGTNGARDGDDVLRFLLSGATAVQLASAILLRGPSALTEAAARVKEYLRDHRVPRVGALVGLAAQASRSYAELVEERGPMPAGPPWSHLLGG
jgi:dihydroorotate dehydrogenase